MSVSASADVSIFVTGLTIFSHITVSIVFFQEFKGFFIKIHY